MDLCYDKEVHHPPHHAMAKMVGTDNWCLTLLTSGNVSSVLVVIVFVVTLIKDCLFGV